MKYVFNILFLIFCIASCTESEPLDNNDFYEIYSAKRLVLDLSSDIYVIGDEPVKISAHLLDELGAILPNIQADILVNGELISEGSYSPQTTGVFTIEASISKLNLSTKKQLTSVYLIDLVDRLALDLSTDIYFEGDQPIHIIASSLDKSGAILTRIQPEILVNGELIDENNFTPPNTGIYTIEASIPELNISLEKQLTSVYYSDLEELKLEYNGLPFLTSQPWSTLTDFSLSGLVTGVGKVKININNVIEQSTSNKILPGQTFSQAGTYSFISNLDSYTSNAVTVEVRAQQELPTIQLPVIFHFINTNVLVGDVSNVIEEANNILQQPFEINHEENPNKINLQVEFYLATSDPTGKTLSTKGVHIISSGNKDTDFETAQNIARENYWNPNQYLNVYVVSGDYSEITGGEFNPAGIANFAAILNYDLPGSWVLSSEPETPIFNGIFMNDNLSPGVFLHEFGHVMNLLHNFDTSCPDHGDFLKDTYAYDRATNTNCETFPLIQSNIMDYGGIQNVFTYDQADRVQKVIEHGLFIPTPRNMKKRKSEYNHKILPEIKSDFVF